MIEESKPIVDDWRDEGKSIGEQLNDTGQTGDYVQPAGDDSVEEEVTSDEPKSDEVVVDKSILEKLLSRVDRLEEDNEILRGAADKGRLSRIESLRAQGKLVKTAKVNFLDNKAVVGWSKVKDDVYFDSEGKLHETQIVKVYLDGKDGEKETRELDYRTFSRTMQKVEGEVISESSDKDGNVSCTIQLKDGREYKIDVLFIN